MSRSLKVETMFWAMLGTGSSVMVRVGVGGVLVRVAGTSGSGEVAAGFLIRLVAAAVLSVLAFFFLFTLGILQGQSS